MLDAAYSSRRTYLLDLKKATYVTRTHNLLITNQLLYQLSYTRI